MKNNSGAPSNFWFGFALGTIAATAGSYLFGTKNGRDTIEKILDFSENLEENLQLLNAELKKELKLPEHKINITEEKKHIEEAVMQVKESKPLGSILEKIHSLTPHNLPNRFKVAKDSHNSP